MYSTPDLTRSSKILLEASALIAPPNPTGDWYISQGDFISTLLFCSAAEMLTTGIFSSSKNLTCLHVKDMRSN